MHRAQPNRFGAPQGVTLLETIIVLAIIAGLLGLLLPALQRARDAARNATCCNNLHQLYLAMHEIFVAKKSLPKPAQPGVASGWAIEILPFLEDRALADELANRPIANQPTASPINHRPSIMTCPFGWQGDSSLPPIPVSHYTFALGSQRHSFVFADLPLDSRVPWPQSPELNIWSMPPNSGPHLGGYHVAQSNGYVSWFNGNN